VTLVDVRSDPIEEITPTGLRTGKQSFELDAIVFATGFDAMTGALREIDVRTSDGRNGGAALRDHWEGGPLTYLGLMVSGFPNMFVVTGPGSPGVKTQMIASIEQHVDWIADAIDHLHKHQLDRIEPDAAGRERLGAPCQPGRRLDALSAGQLLVHGRQHPRQAARVHALCRRLRPLQEALRRGGGQGLRGLQPLPARRRQRLKALFVHHRIDAAPRPVAAVAKRLMDGGARRIAGEGGALYGIWRSQIGRPRDELQVITAWPGAVHAADAEAALLEGEADVWIKRSETLTPTLRPTDSKPPVRQGNYAFRWFATPERHWPEFLDLCAAAWPGFERAYDSQVIGFGTRPATVPASRATR